MAKDDPENPVMAADESFAAVHTTPLDHRLKDYLAAVVEYRPTTIHFSTGAGHILFDLFERWPKVNGHEHEAHAVCNLITQAIHPLTAKLFAQAVDITITMAPPVRIAPAISEDIATYMVIDLAQSLVHTGYLAPGRATPAKLREPLEMGITVLSRPLHYGYHMIKESRESRVRHGTSGLPVRDPSNRNRDFVLPAGTEGSVSLPAPKVEPGTMGPNHPLGGPRIAAEERLLNVHMQHDYERIEPKLQKMPPPRPAPAPENIREPEAKPQMLERLAAKLADQRRLAAQIWRKFVPQPGPGGEE